MVQVTLAANASGGRWALMPGLLVSGVGIGCVWTPVFSIATATLKPELGGVASGVLSTVQELGAVVGTATMGAVLQNRLAHSLHSGAVERAGELPAPYRSGFVAGFDDAAKSGLDAGAGQSGAKMQVPRGIPQDVAERLSTTAHSVFTHGFVAAMRPSLVLPIIAIVVAAGAAAPARRSHATAAA